MRRDRRRGLRHRAGAGRQGCSAQDVGAGGGRLDRSLRRWPNDDRGRVTNDHEAEPVATTAPRRTTTTARPTQLAPVVHGDDFWWRLARCESRNGELSDNQFQFQGGTAEKVGYYPGASYEAQRAMAIDWAARIHPREGTTAGWPVCWWTAGGS